VPRFSEAELKKFEEGFFEQLPSIASNLSIPDYSGDRIFHVDVSLANAFTLIASVMDRLRAM